MDPKLPELELEIQLAYQARFRSKQLLRTFYFR